MTEDEVRWLVEQVKAGLIGLAKAPPAQKAAMYRTLGLKLTYHPETDTLDIVRPDQMRIPGVVSEGGPTQSPTGDFVPGQVCSGPAAALGGPDPSAVGTRCR